MSLSHHSLVAWQRVDDLCIKLHQLSLRRLPAHERYELRRQTRRAAYSVAANIVEGLRDGIEELVCIFSTSRSPRSPRSATAFMSRCGLVMCPKERPVNWKLKSKEWVRPLLV